MNVKTTFMNGVVFRSSMKKGWLLKEVFMSIMKKGWICKEVLVQHEKGLVLRFSSNMKKSSLLRNPNEGCVKKLSPLEVNIPTYHFVVEKRMPSVASVVHKI